MEKGLKIAAAALAMLAATSCTRSVNRTQHLPIECHQYPNREPAVCELASDGGVVVSRQSLVDISFEPDGLGSIVVDSRGLYFVMPQGKTAPTLEFDNGADYVVEGLARTVKKGKVGLVNVQLDHVVTPVWDFAFPFEHGVAVVCTGCVSTPVSPGDEHRTMTGGKWGYIDKGGKIVVPVVYDSRSLPPAEIAEKMATQ
jgi:WG containing repeat